LVTLETKGGPDRSDQWELFVNKDNTQTQAVPRRHRSQRRPRPNPRQTTPWITTSWLSVSYTASTTTVTAPWYSVRYRTRPDQPLCNLHTSGTRFQCFFSLFQTMSYNQVSAQSLTPSRPAPQAPQRRGPDNSSFASNNLANSGYNSSFTFTPASPSGSSYAFPYSGIGGSPNRGPEDPNNSQVLRSGSVNMKEEGFGNWIFQRKWLVLREQSLTVHKSEVSFASTPSNRTWLYFFCC